MAFGDELAILGGKAAIKAREARNYFRLGSGARASSVTVEPEDEERVNNAYQQPQQQQPQQQQPQQHQPQQQPQQQQPQQHQPPHYQQPHYQQPHYQPPQYPQLNQQLQQQLRQQPPVYHFVNNDAIPPFGAAPPAKAQQPRRLSRAALQARHAAPNNIIKHVSKASPEDCVALIRQREIQQGINLSPAKIRSDKQKLAVLKDTICRLEKQLEQAHEKVPYFTSLIPEWDYAEDLRGEKRYAESMDISLKRRRIEEEEPEQPEEPEEPIWE